MGLDVGTQGARAVIVDGHGNVHAQGESPFELSALAATVPGAFEQEPSSWRTASYAAIAASLAAFREQGRSADEIAALSVTSTSGTLCLIDADGRPVRPAIMYSDARSAEVSHLVQDAGAELALKLGTRFGASFALSKLCWVQQQEPGHLERARWFTSPTDLVIGWLCGRYDRTDWTNALKWGYDVLDLRWPEFISQRLGLPADKFPQVQAPGTPIAQVVPQVAEHTGLSPRTLVVAGATDGTASQLASGAAAPGDWNSTLGTTLVLKGVSRQLLRDPEGRLYCHRHPDGDWWLPGGASSTGADCLSLRFAREDLPSLNALALERSPTDLVVYPLMRKGERLPFSVPDAQGFYLGEAPDKATDFCAHLEGLAYVERMSYEVVASLGGQVGDVIHVAGGAIRSEAGLQIRSDVLGKRLQVPCVPLGAMGAAILAAAGYRRATISATASAMVHYERVVEPRLDMGSAYHDRYERFVRACRERGYVA